MSNFGFLKKIDEDLYNIAGIAEKLYRDEYFEQCMAQTRRFAENTVKKILGPSAPCDASFDDLINTLKDRTQGTSIEKEFIDDLYFLKKAGNVSVHSIKVKNDGITAIECLRRAFEVAINYAVYKDKTNAKLLRLNYDEELLILGTPKKEKTLKEKYIQEKEKVTKKPKKERVRVQTQNRPPARAPKTKSCKKSKKYPEKQQSGLPLFLHPLVVAFSITVGLAVIFVFLFYFKIL